MLVSLVLGWPPTRTDCRRRCTRFPPSGPNWLVSPAGDNAGVRRIETWAVVLVVGAAGGVYDLLTSTFPVASVSLAMAAIYLVLLFGAPAALIMAIVSAWHDRALIAYGAAAARSVAAARGLRWSSVISIAFAV